MGNPFRVKVSPGKLFTRFSIVRKELSHVHQDGVTQAKVDEKRLPVSVGVSFVLSSKAWVSFVHVDVSACDRYCIND